MPKNRIIPVFIPHAGCPNACVFCNQRKIAGTLIPPSPDEVKRLICEGLEKNGGFCEVAFYGGSFTAIPECLQNAYLSAVSEFLPRLSGLRLSTRPDAVDDAIALRLKRFGVSTVELGAQSMDNRVLFLARRGHSAEDTERAAECVKRNGLKLVLQIMPGLPGDSAEGAVKTAETVAALRPDAVRVYPVVVVEGTELAEMWRRGEYKPMSLDEAAEVCAEIAETFAAQGIPVIRMGLNPSDELSGGAALAGAYHPAFGELVKSRILLRRVGEMLKKEGETGHKSRQNGCKLGQNGCKVGENGCDSATKRDKNATADLHGGKLTIFAAPSLVSALIGDKRANEMRMKTVFNASKVIIKADCSLFDGEIRLK